MTLKHEVRKAHLEAFEHLGSAFTSLIFFDNAQAIISMRLDTKKMAPVRLLKVITPIVS